MQITVSRLSASRPGRRRGSSAQRQALVANFLFVRRVTGLSQSVCDSIRFLKKVAVRIHLREFRAARPEPYE